MIVLPAMPAEQTASWLGVLDLYDHLDATSEVLRTVIAQQRLGLPRGSRRPAE